MLAGPRGAGKHPVGDVADEDVLEGQLGLAGQPPSLAGHDELALGQRVQRCLQVGVLGLGDGRECRCPERAADDGRLLEQPALERRQPVQARGEQALDRGRQVGDRGLLLLA